MSRTPSGSSGHGRWPATLTGREREVAIAVGEGKVNAQIAEELYLSMATVKAHVSRIMVKLEATNRVQIANRVHDADPH